MDQIKEFLTRRNIIAILILAILAVGLLVGLRLVQQQQQLKSQAATTPVCSGSGESRYCMWFQDPSGGNPTANRDVEVRIVGGQDDKLPQLTGTFNLGSASTFGSGENCWPGQGFKNCWVFVVSGSRYSGGPVSEAFSSEIAQNRVTATYTPTVPQTVTISGRVTKSDGTPIEGVVINQNAINPTNCNIGITTTDSGGNYRFTVERDKQFCLRPPQNSSHNPTPPNSSVGVPPSPTSYENLTATSDNTGFDFVYPPSAPAEPVPSNQATCASITIDGQDLEPATQTVNPGSSHTIEIIMRNPPSDSKNTSKSWESGYSLRFTSGTEAAKALGLNPTSVPLTAKIEPQKTFESGSSITITPPRPVAAPINFVWQMHDGSGTPFGGECQRQITVGSVSAPGASPAPTPAPVDFDVDTGGDRTVTQGSTISQVVEVTRRDSNPGSPSVNLSVSGFPTGVSGSFSGTSCAPRVNESCTRTLTIEAAGNASTITSTVTVTAKYGQLEKRADFHLTVRPATTAFNFTVSTPSDITLITLTKGQSDAGRNITISKTAGDAEDVTLSVSGDLGSAVASFKPSSSCKPENNSQCQRILTFDTSAATVGEYVVEIQGRASGGRTQVSNPFRLKINPSVGTVTCFVVSESGNTVSLFKDCLQSSIDNINRSGSLAGFIEDTPLFPNFQLSSGNVQKTLFVRFLQIPEGGFIKGSCTANPNKCKETTAGITLALPIPTPTPTPTPTPVTGCLCQSDNTCSAVCLFEEISPEPSGVTYTTPKKCNPMPGHSITANKNVWCQNRTLRTKGDADGDGKVNSKDYLFLLTGQFNGTLPANVYPDFNGNGVADNQDLIIWQNAPKTP